MEIISPETLQNIGLISIAIVAAFITTLTAAITLTYILFRNTRLIKIINNRISSIILRIQLLLLDLLYMPAKKIIITLGGNDLMIDAVSTEIRNILFKKRFSATPFNERIVILPQCLRSLECPAKFSSVEGAQCMSCGKCKIKDIAKKAQELGYKGTYIAPGGGFVKRIIKKTKPKAVIGVGCPYEVNWGMLEVSNKGIPCQGVVLLKTGCVTTDVDLATLYETMELYEQK